MARVTYVKNARKPNRCERCGKDINKGDPYKHVSPRAYRGARGYKRVRCAECPSWKPSELTSSSQLATLYGAQEAYDEADKGSPEAWASALGDLAEGIREAGQMYTESADNMESGFGTSTTISDEIREKGEGLETWADEVEQAASEVEQVELKCGECGELEEDGPHHEFEQAEDEEQVGCDVEDCDEPESSHHDFDESGWESEAEDLASVVENSPL